MTTHAHPEGERPKHFDPRYEQVWVWSARWPRESDFEARNLDEHAQLKSDQMLAVTPSNHYWERVFHRRATWLRHARPERSA